MPATQSQGLCKATLLWLRKKSWLASCSNARHVDEWLACKLYDQGEVEAARRDTLVADASKHIGSVVAVVNDDPVNYPEYQYGLMLLRAVEECDEIWRDADRVAFQPGDVVLKGKWLLKNEGHAGHVYTLCSRPANSGTLLENLICGGMKVTKRSRQNQGVTYVLGETTHQYILRRLEDQQSANDARGTAASH